MLLNQEELVDASFRNTNLEWETGEKNALVHAMFALCFCSCSPPTEVVLRTPHCKQPPLHVSYLPCMLPAD